MSTAIQQRLCANGPLYVSVLDLSPHQAAYDIGVPVTSLPPNIVYLLCIGVRDGVAYYKFGITEYFKVRMHKGHDSAFPHAKTIFIINCGTHEPKPVEDCIKRFTQENSISILVGRELRRECFSINFGDEGTYVQAIRDHVRQTQAEIVKSIKPFVEGETFQSFDAGMQSKLAQLPDQVTIAKLALDGEVEKTKQEQEKTRQEQEKTRQEREQTRRAEIAYETLKLQIATGALRTEKS